MAEAAELVDRGDDFVADVEDAVETDVAVEEKADEKADEKSEEKAEKSEEKTDEKAEKNDEKPKKDGRIPAARHAEILNRERARREAVEAELARYKGGEQVAAVGAKLTELEDEVLKREVAHAKMLVDGDHDKAAAEMTKIRKIERQINEQNAIARENAAEARAVERVRYDVTCDRIEAAYPALDQNSDEFDKDVSAEVVDLQEAYQMKGLTPSQALQKAVKLIMGAPETKAQESAIQVTARVDPAALAKAKKLDANDKLDKAIAKTPANTAKVGVDSDKKGGSVSAKDVLKMTDKEFRELDEKTMSRMRGDEFVPS